MVFALPVRSVNAATAGTTLVPGQVMKSADSGRVVASPVLFEANGNVGVGTSSLNARFTLVGDYSEGVVTANTGTSYTIALTSGTVQILTLTGNCAFTFPAATTAGRGFTLLLRQDGTGNKTVTWPGNVRWPGGTAPTITSTASRTDKYVFIADGTNWLGSNAGQNYPG